MNAVHAKTPNKVVALGTYPFLGLVTLAALILSACTGGDQKAINRRGTGDKATQVDCKANPQLEACILAGKSGIASLAMNAPTSAVSGAEILVTWEAVPTAATYDLSVSSDEACSKAEFQMKNISSTSQVLILSKPGTYYLCMKPIDDKGKEVVVQSTPFKITVSQSESALVAAKDLRGLVENNEMTSALLFSWTAGKDGVHKIASYTLKYYDQAGCMGKTTTVSKLKETTYKATSVDKGATYSFTIETLNELGHSALSECSEPFVVPGAVALDTVAPVPGADGVIMATTGLSLTGFTLTWTSASDALTQAGALEYFVCSGASQAAVKTVNDCFTAQQEMGWTAGVTSLVISGKSPASSHHFNVLVRDGSGNKSSYKAVSQTTLADTTAPVPGAFTASSGVGELGFTLNWQAATDDFTPAASLDYFVCSAANASALDSVAKCLAATMEKTWTPNLTSLALSSKTPATSYHYNIVVRDAAGNQALYAGKTQATAADATPPTAGSFSASTGVGHTGFTLNWTAASDLGTAVANLQYFVCSGVSAAAIDTVGECLGATQEMNWVAHTTSFNVTGKSPASTSYYNVVVKDAAGNQALYDGKTQATIADTTVPGAGSFSASSGVGTNGFTLNWSAASDNVTAAASLEYFVCSGASVAAIDTASECTSATQEMNWTANTTTLTLTGKTPATTYYYNVVVRDAAGNQTIYNAQTQATAADALAPTAGTFSASSGVGNTGFTLQWSAASDLVTSAASLEYFVCSGAAAVNIDTAAECVAATQEMNWTTNTTSLAISGKAPATTYYYNVVVRDAAGNEAIYDGKAQATTADTTDPSAGSFATSSGVGSTAFTLNWTAASDNVTAAASLEYFVCSGASAAAIDTASECTAASQEMNWTANTTTLTLSGKTPATTYYYNVVVRDAAGRQAIYNGIAQATASDVVAPTAGTFSASSGVGNTGFTLNWTAASDLVTAAANLEYFVCSGAAAVDIDTAAECVVATQEMNWTANTTSLVISGKSPSTTYYFNVVVRDAAANPAIYNGLTQATTADVTNPTAGTFSASSGVGATGFTLNWTTASDNVTAAASLQYFVCSGASAAAIDTASECTSATQVMNWTTNATSVAVSGLSPLTTYYYNVVVQDAAGNPAIYNGLSQATTADGTNPTAGTFSASSGVTDSGFTLNWSAASDNVTTAASLEYFVCSGANAAAIDTASECTAATQAMNWTANTTTLAISGKTPGTTYYYNVVVRDAAGNPSIYNGIAQATAADATNPTAASFWQTHVLTDRSFTLRWGAASDNYTAAASLEYFVCSGANAAAIDTVSECVAATQEMNWTTNRLYLNVTGKSASTAYYYNVVVRDANDNRAIYNGESVTTLASAISIDSGATYATSTSVTLTLAADRVDDRYVTNTSGCGSGGTWEAYGTSKAWTLTQTNSTATVYVKYRNGSYESPCISDTIIHDALPTISVSGSPFTFTKNTAITSITPTLGASVVSVAISPSLPTGMSFNTTTGVISGTPSVYATQASYTLTASNTAGSTATATISITVNDVAPTISVTGSPFTYVGGNSVTITPSLGASVASVAISPALSNGLSLNTTTGVISGTSSGSMFSTSYTLTATNATGQTATASLSILINAAVMPVPTSAEVGMMSSHSAQINWAPVTSVPLSDYEVAIGTTSGGTDIYSWTSVGVRNSVFIGGLTLDTATPYYASVRSKNSSNIVSSARTATSYKPSPTRVSVGEAHSCFLNGSGALKCFGNNYYGQLGIGSTAKIGDGTGAMGNSLPAVSLGAGRTAVAVDTSSNHTCAVLDNGQLKCWGGNGYGNLGTGAWTYPSDGSGAAINLGSGRTAVDVATGLAHTCAVLDDGTVKCWGEGRYGALGYGNTADKGFSAATIGDNLAAVDLGTGRTAVEVVAGGQHTCARLDNGSVKCWGYGGGGRLGYGNTATRGDGANEMGDNLPAVDLGTGRTAIALSAGMESTCAVLDNNTLKCWGSQMWGGMLGTGTSTNYGAASNTMGNNLPTVNVGTGRTVVEVAAGTTATCARLDNGSVKCWGYSGSGELGYGDRGFRGDTAGSMGDNLPAVDLGTGRTALKIAAARYAFCAILDNNTVKCWGANENGELGQEDTDARGFAPNQMGDNLLAVKLGTGRTAVAIAGGHQSWERGNSFCAVLDDGSLKCWGGNEYGQLGLGSTTQKGDQTTDAFIAVNLGSGVTARRPFAGANYSCVTLDDGNMKCWGYNYDGQLGVGNNALYGRSSSSLGDFLPFAELGTGRSVLWASAREHTTCVLLDNFDTKCWGYGNSNNLGYGSTADKGRDAATSGDNLPAVDLGSGRTASYLAVGTKHSCAILDNGTLKCWGENNNGQLGYGDTTTRGTGPNQMGDNLGTVNLGTGLRPIQVALGQYHTCAILNDRSVKCWGSNDFGMLGLGDSSHRGDAAGEMGDNLPTVNLGTGRTALQLALGNQSTCALLDNYTVKCWGRGWYGVLGQGSVDDIGSGANQMGDNLPAIALGTGRTAREIVSNHATVCATLDNGTLKCWGENGNGQLGQGNTVRVGDGANEMGDFLPALNP